MKLRRSNPCPRGESDHTSTRLSGCADGFRYRSDFGRLRHGRREGREGLGASALLTALTAMVTLIGGEGLLYVPSIVLFIWGAVSSSQRSARAA